MLLEMNCNTNKMPNIKKTVYAAVLPNFSELLHYGQFSTTQSFNNNAQIKILIQTLFF